jgi:hypothetical protein
MKVLELTENEDGSANCELDLSPEEKEAILSLGFNSLIRKCIDLESGEEGEQVVNMVLNPDAVWAELIGDFCKELSNPNRGGHKFTIPVDWVVDLIKDNWTTSGIQAMNDAGVLEEMKE